MLSSLKIAYSTYLYIQRLQLPLCLKILQALDECTYISHIFTQIYLHSQQLYSYVVLIVIYLITLKLYIQLSFDSQIFDNYLIYLKYFTKFLNNIHSTLLTKSLIGVPLSSLSKKNSGSVKFNSKNIWEFDSACHHSND